MGEAGQPRAAIFILSADEKAVYSDRTSGVATICDRLGRPLTVVQGTALADRQRDALGIFGDALWQSDLPLSVAVIYLEYNGRFSGRVVGSGLDEEEVRPHL